MNPAEFRAFRSSVHAHDHAVYVYDDEHEVLYPLDHFLREGIEAGQLTTFVHSHPTPKAAHGFISSKIEDVADRERAKDLVLAHHRDAFERGGRIHHEHVLSIVGMLDGDARQHGKKGVRIFVDASKRYLESGRADEWFAFESWLGPRLEAGVGLVCAYRASDLRDPRILAKVLETHAYRFNAPGAPMP